MLVLFEDFGACSWAACTPAMLFDALYGRRHFPFHPCFPLRLVCSVLPWPLLSGSIHVQRGLVIVWLLCLLFFEIKLDFRCRRWFWCKVTFGQRSARFSFFLCGGGCRLGVVFTLIVLPGFILEVNYLTKSEK